MRKVGLARAEESYAAPEFFSGLGARDIIIAEGTGTPDGDTLAAFREYGYLPLAERFRVKFCNLHDDEKVVVDAFDADWKHYVHTACPGWEAS